MKKININSKHVLTEIGAILLGSLLFSVSMNMFLLPENIVMGGATGVATILNYLFNMPIGTVIILFNIPLMMLNAKQSGWKFLVRTIIGVFSTSLAIDLLAPIIPVPEQSPMLCAILGGVSMGAGSGLLISRGYTTGGTDLVAWLLKPHFPRLSTGKLILIVDAFIIAISAFVMKSFEGVIYSAVSIYAFSMILDLVIAGSTSAKAAIIFSDKYESISDEVLSSVGHGTTLLHASGGYTKQERPALLCVVKPDELYRIREIVYRNDKNAFMLILDIREVLGDGFSPPHISEKN